MLDFYILAQGIALKKIGLTGSIGAGKSTVGKLLRERGFAVLDCDAEVHRLYASNESLRGELAKKFGKSVLTADGVSREYLADIVFKDSEKRSLLESIVYPYLEKSIENFFTSSANEGKAFIEAALLFKVPNTLAKLDEVWNVDASAEVRLERLVKRGLNREDAMRRIELQKQNPALNHSQIVNIDNSRTEAELQETLKSII